MARYGFARYNSHARYDESAGPPSKLMNQNLVQGTLTQADFDAVMAAFDTILTKLPFAVELSPEERQALPKQGPKSLEFVTGMKTLANQNLSAVPSVVPLTEFNGDVTLCGQMFQLSLKGRQVFERISDTLMACGSDCFVAALLLYKVFRALGLPGLDANLDNLGRRFSRAGGGSEPEPPPTT